MSPDIKLTIIDGIIGQVISYKVFQSEIKQPFHPEKYGMSLEEFLKLSKEEQYYYVKKDCLFIEVDTYVENNPIVKKASELYSLIGSPAYSLGPVKDINYNYTMFYGRSCILQLGSFSKVKSEVILPKFKAPGFNLGLIVDKIALILACSKAIQLMQI